MSKTSINRRQAFSVLAVTAAGGAMMSQSALAETKATAPAVTASLLPRADICMITPEVTEGPYYFDPSLERADITEDRPGVATLIRLQIIDQACLPIEGARVDIWHCDATGLYSGYANQGENGTVSTVGETFMRGTLFADANGMVEFETVYPGWYRGRTTHVHFKVFVTEANVLTGQIFFPDALSEYLYVNVAPYNARTAERDTVNASDSIAQQSTRASFAYVKELATAYLAEMIIGVDPSAVSSTGVARPPGGRDGSSRPGGPPPRGAVGSNGTRERGSIIPSQEKS